MIKKLYIPTFFFLSFCNLNSMEENPQATRVYAKALYALNNKFHFPPETEDVAFILRKISSQPERVKQLWIQIINEYQQDNYSQILTYVKQLTTIQQGVYTNANPFLTVTIALFLNLSRLHQVFNQSFAIFVLTQFIVNNGIKEIRKLLSSPINQNLHNNNNIWFTWNNILWDAALGKNYVGKAKSLLDTENLIVEWLKHHDIFKIIPQIPLPILQEIMANIYPCFVNLLTGETIKAYNPDFSPGEIIFLINLSNNQKCMSRHALYDDEYLNLIQIIENERLFWESDLKPKIIETLEFMVQEEWWNNMPTYPPPFPPRQNPFYLASYPSYTPPQAISRNHYSNCQPETNNWLGCIQ